MYYNGQRSVTTNYVHFGKTYARIYRTKYIELKGPSDNSYIYEIIYGYNNTEIN